MIHPSSLECWIGGIVQRIRLSYIYTHDDNWRNTYDQINVSGVRGMCSGIRGVFIICSVAVVVCLYMMYPASWND